MSNVLITSTRALTGALRLLGSRRPSGPSRRVGVAKLTAAAGVAAIALAMAAPLSADATTFTENPFYYCFARSAAVQVEPLRVPPDGYFTTWGAALYRWNGASWGVYQERLGGSFFDGGNTTSLNYNGSNTVTIGGSNLNYSLPTSIPFGGLPHGYYAVVVKAQSTDGRPLREVWANPLEKYFEPYPTSLGASYCRI